MQDEYELLVLCHKSDKIYFKVRETLSKPQRVFLIICSGVSSVPPESELVQLYEHMRRVDEAQSAHENGGGGGRGRGERASERESEMNMRKESAGGGEGVVECAAV